MDLASIRLPSGFRIDLFASDLPNARALALGEAGTLFVGTRSDGRVFALRDADGDGHADQRWTLAQGLDMPNGVAFRSGSLYVAASGRVIRYDGIEDALDSPPPAGDSGGAAGLRPPRLAGARHRSGRQDLCRNGRTVQRL